MSQKQEENGLAKEIIDKIVEAEADSGKVVQEAAEKADALKKTAAAEAEAAFEKAVNETNKKAAERVAAAEKKAEAFVEEAVKTAESDKNAMKEVLAAKMNEAADSVIALIR